MDPILVVGEAPSRGGGGEPLVGALGRVPRLAEFERTNLLSCWPGVAGKGSLFPMIEGERAAEALLGRTPPGVRLILMGTRVASAFGIPRSAYSFLEWFEWEDRAYAVCPHPSGIVRWWNEAENRRSAIAFFDRAAEESWNH